MFFRMNIMKKLLKEAYKTNRLLIAHNEDGTYPEGYLISNRANWIVWVSQAGMSKEFLAALIEIVGDLPETGKFYVEGKSGRMTIEDNESLEGLDTRLFESFVKPVKAGKVELFNISDLVLEQSTANARILQSDTGETTLINNFVTKLVSKTMIDSSIGEWEPYGPARIHNTHWMSWNSGVCVFAIVERTCSETNPVEKEILDVLRTLDLKEGGQDE